MSSARGLSWLVVLWCGCVLMLCGGGGGVCGPSLVSAARLIVPGAAWQTVGGGRIEAHAPGVLRDPVDGGWWWFGESAKTGNLSEHGVNCYHSTDLYSWTSIGQVINQAAIRVPGRRGPYTMERPKVLHHAGSGAYVMWFHIDDDAYDVRRVGVAVSYDVAGAGFSFVRSFQPDGLPSLDMSLYEDRQNGSVLGAYFVRSVDNAYVGISRLTDDYMDTQGLTSIIPEAREGHAIFHYHTRYFMLTSHLSGWAPNDMEAFVSGGDSLAGAEWTSLGNPTGSRTSFDSQPALVLPFTDAGGAPYFIYLGDRWAAPNLLNASYIWLPIILHPNLTLSIPWRDAWDLDHPFGDRLTIDAPATFPTPPPPSLADLPPFSPLDTMLPAAFQKKRTRTAQQQL